MSGSTQGFENESSRLQSANNGVYGHTHQPLPSLRSAMKHSSRSSSPIPGTASPLASPPTITSPLPSAGPRTTHSYSLPPSPPVHPKLAHHSLSSPPSTLQGTHHTAGYTPKVSFDTFENPAASMFSFTLQVKSAGYERTRNTRVFLCAASPDESGREALDWCLEALVQDGDELIVFRGVDEEVLDKDHDLVRDEARELMRTVEEKSAEYDSSRKLSLVLEYVPGKITDTLDRLIALYRPDSVVVGTRGRRSWQGMGVIGMGSVSKYCLSHSPVPVIVVRPERKLKKAVEKRRADPKRGKHFE